jgi:hypothetical protein
LQNNFLKLIFGQNKTTNLVKKIDLVFSINKMPTTAEEIIKIIENGDLKDCDNDTISDIIFALYQNTNIIHPTLGNTKTQHTEKS